MLKNGAIQTEPMLVNQLSFCLENLESSLKNKYKLKREPGGFDVVIYFTPENHAFESIDGLPAFYLAIKTYTKTGKKTVGPRVEIGTRDSKRFGMILKSLHSDWIVDTSEEYLKLDASSITMILRGDEKMPLYTPELYKEGSEDWLELFSKVQKGAKEMKRISQMIQS